MTKGGCFEKIEGEREKKVKEGGGKVVEEKMGEKVFEMEESDFLVSVEEEVKVKSHTPKADHPWRGSKPSFSRTGYGGLSSMMPEAEQGRLKISSRQGGHNPSTAKPLSAEGQKEALRKMGKIGGFEKCSCCEGWNCTLHAYEPHKVGWVTWCLTCGLTEKV